MTSTRSPDGADLSDEELTAWLDGEADAALRARVAAAQSEALEVRLAELERGKAHGQALFDRVLDQMPDGPTVSLPARPVVGGWAMGGLGASLGAVATLAIVLGGFWGGLWGAEAPVGAGSDRVQLAMGEPWHREAAAYHALYVPETLAPHVPSTSEDLPPEAATRLAAVSQALGRDVTILPEVPGLRFVRAQQLGYEGQVLVQLAFAGETGMPYALCILRDAGPESEVQTRTLQGLAAASWSDSDHRFLLIGGDNTAEVRRWAEAFSQAL